MIIRLIIFGLIVFFLIRILRSIFAPASDRRSQFTPERKKMAVDEMVQDPHCGVYVAKKEAYSLRAENKVIYFCSEECCNQYLKKNDPPEK
ncbi:MAG: hypothetical protein J7M06_05215 [Proteobacteria bacterium]|nr:hypothetical protein [Pseudomonadota bacterium]